MKDSLRMISKTDKVDRRMHRVKDTKVFLRKGINTKELFMTSIRM